MIQVNTQILYVLSHPAAPKRLTLSQYKDELINQLVALSGQEIPKDITTSLIAKPGRRSILPKQEVFVGAVHLIDSDGLQNKCVQCQKKRSIYY